MSSKLFNAPTSFQSYITKILAKKLDIFIIVYLDNIIIYTKNWDLAHVNAVWWVIEELQKHSFFPNLKKWQFHKNKVRFLNYVILA